MPRKISVPPSCAEKAHLLEEYRQAAEEYAEAVLKLVKRTDRYSIPEYQRLSEAAEKSGYESTEARDRLERHLAQHGC